MRFSPRVALAFASRSDDAMVAVEFIPRFRCGNKSSRRVRDGMTCGGCLAGLERPAYHHYAALRRLARHEQREGTNTLTCYHTGVVHPPLSCQDSLEMSPSLTHLKCPLL